MPMVVITSSPLSSVRKHLESIRVYDFRIEIILLYVHTLIILTAGGNSRSHYLGKSVYVMGLYVKSLLYLVSHALGPWLGAENARIDRKGLRVYSRLFHGFGYGEGV